MKRLIFGLLLLLISSLVFISPRRVQSETAVQEKTKQIEELEKKVAELKNQAKTLSGQIAYYDGQIALNILKISQTEDLIATLSGKINALETSLQERSTMLEKQIVASYKQGQADPTQLLFSATNFSNLVSRLKYSQITQNYNRRFLHDTQVVQSTYANHRDLIEISRKKLETQKQQLDSLKQEKQNLLVQTKNNETTYQKQLEVARLELIAIQRALAESISEGPVKAGDPIALTGNSGYPSCSTGKHLHFEVRLNDNWVNAEVYLKSMTDRLGVTLGSGKWDWPLTGSVVITQRYGKTPWSYRYVYSGGIHTGIDMVSDNDIIRAPADGTLYSSVQKCGSSPLNIKYIDHGGGLKTFYLHVQ